MNKNKLNTIFILKFCHFAVNRSIQVSGFVSGVKNTLLKYCKNSILTATKTIQICTWSIRDK